MCTNETELQKEKLRARGVQVEKFSSFTEDGSYFLEGFYWFGDDQGAAPSRLFDTELEAWEAAYRWIFEEVDFDEQI